MRAAIAGVLAGLALAVAVVSSAYAGGSSSHPERTGCEVCSAIAPAGGR